MAVSTSRWTGLLEPSTSSGMAGWAYVLQILTVVIVVGWLVIAAIGLLGLIRRMRAE